MASKDLIAVRFERAVTPFRAGEVGGIERKRFPALAAAGAVKALDAPPTDKAVKAPTVKK